jgi:hypothetical protein
VSPVRYELGAYIPEDRILHRHSRENLKSYIIFTLFYIHETSLEVLSHIMANIHDNKFSVEHGNNMRQKKMRYDP